ncbi:alanine/glycine:cation symporter family protein [Fusobacterium sp. PH5-44]|uniref:alanine/glycine:cation symporter family protein n=1 Tax=unclassified Fusobacterium TaxID=2648384 RepID=UPI003D252F72
MLERLIDTFVNFVGSLNALLWGKLIAVSLGQTEIELSLLVVILIPVGIYFTIKTRFLPFRLFPEMIRCVLEPKSSTNEDSISGVQALFIATASRVGMGNLAGVVAAISFGGAGAIFWMWVAALIGSSSAFVESTLAQIYKEKDPLYGGFRGGPSYFMDRMRLITWIKDEDEYIKNPKSEAKYISADGNKFYTRGTRFKLLGILFALSGLLCWAGISQVIANSVSQSFANAFSIKPLYTTITLVIVSGIVLFSNKGIVDVLNKVVPIMAILYFSVTLFIIVKNINLVPAMISNILSQAFGLKQMVAGGFGAILMQGVKRGLFSNEAGSGSAPCAAAAADVSHPVKQGLIQSLGVFIDTLIICSCSAFIMLLAPEGITKGLMGMDLLQAAMQHHIGRIGVIFIAIILFLFSFSTFLGIMFYARGNVAYVFGDNWLSQNIYKIFALGMLLIGGLAQYTFVWDLGDLGVGLMTIFNMIAIIPLSSQVIASLKDYEKNHMLKK